MERRRFFATTSKGLEEVLAGELADLEAPEIAVAPGGVSFTGDDALGVRANLWLRTAHRVLLLLSEFPAAPPDDLYEGVSAVPWPDLFPPTRTIAVDATVRESGIVHSGFAARKAKDAIVDRFREQAGSRPDVDLRNPDVRIAVRIVRDAAALSLDLSGESLNRRGYRESPAGAPLRETLAAGVILLSGWDGRAPLVDPMCGAGTIPVEAALVATGTAPGSLGRTFGFQALYGYDRALFEDLVAQARRRVRTRGIGRIEGSDVDAAVLRGAGDNARRSNMDPYIRFHRRDVRDLDPGGPPGVIICNPPYGFRMEAEEEKLYRAMGEAFKKRCRGWTAWILSGNPRATRFLGLKASRKIPLMNGPIDCRLLEYRLY